MIRFKLGLSTNVGGGVLNKEEEGFPANLMHVR
jgi:hypothetical protein